MFYVLFWVILMWVCTYFKVYRAISFIFFHSQLYLNKIVEKKTENKEFGERKGKIEAQSISERKHRLK